MTKRVLLIAAFSFVACVYLHDDQHPESLTDAEKEYVLKTLREVDEKIEVTLERIEEFNEHPKDSEFQAQLLANAFSDWKALSQIVEAEPVFYYSLDSEPPDSTWLASATQINASIAGRVQAINDATSRMANEIVRRGDSIDLDSEAFLNLRDAVDLPPRSKTAPCLHRECSWCRTRIAWQFAKERQRSFFGN